MLALKLQFRRYKRSIPTNCLLADGGCVVNEADVRPNSLLRHYRKKPRPGDAETPVSNSDIDRF